MIITNLIKMIGNTPVLHYKNINQNDIYIKMEMFNPGGSIKDRIALQMIEDLQKEGKINENTKFVESTSGNTGIGLALVLANLGYDLTITMPINMSKERINLMKAYGAHVILTDLESGMEGASNKALELEKEGYLYINQFNNLSNIKAHIKTADEIKADFPDSLDYIISGIGTAGTITGLATYLKPFYPDLKIIGIEPYESSVISNGTIGRHGIPGIGAGFLPPLLDISQIDEIMTVKSFDAQMQANCMAKKGLFLGISSGAAIFAAEQLATTVRNKKILVISPDGGNKYMSLGVYGDETE